MNLLRFVVLFLLFSDLVSVLKTATVSDTLRYMCMCLYLMFGELELPNNNMYLNIHDFTFSFLYKISEKWRKMNEILKKHLNFELR